jgi:hypothetical protein
MKKNILLIALSFALSTINAQNIQTNGVSFTQTLFPKKTLPASIKNYAVTVTTPYLKDDSTFRKIAEDKYQTDLKNYPNVIADAKKKFDEVEMVNYNVKLEEAKERYENGLIKLKETAEQVEEIEKIVKVKGVEAEKKKNEAEKFAAVVGIEKEKVEAEN